MQPGVTIQGVVWVLWGFSRQTQGVDFGLGGKCSSRARKRLRDSSPRKAHTEVESSEKAVKAVLTVGFPMAQRWGRYSHTKTGDATCFCGIGPKDCGGCLSSERRSLCSVIQREEEICAWIP